jgi:hypothetical protein
VGVQAGFAMGGVAAYSAGKNLRKV